MSRWILSLPRVERPYGELHQVAWAKDRPELEAFLARERAVPYRLKDEPFDRWFRPAGPLANFLPPWEADPRCFHELPELKDHLVQVGKDYRDLFQRVPYVGHTQGESSDRPTDPKSPDRVGAADG